MADELKSKVDVAAVRYGVNRAAMLVLLGAVRGEEEKIREGGGVKAAEAQRLTVRERIALLVDPVEEASLSRDATHGGETAINRHPAKWWQEKYLLMWGEQRLDITSAMHHVDDYESPFLFDKAVEDEMPGEPWNWMRRRSAIGVVRKPHKLPCSGKVRRARMALRTADSQRVARSAFCFDS